MPGERECAICYCPYTQGSRAPRILPCRHTFCSQCLLALLALAEPGSPGFCQLLCPLCRQPAQAGREGAELPFPVDPSLGELAPPEGPREEAIEGTGDGRPAGLKRRAKGWMKGLRRTLGLPRLRQSNSGATCVTVREMALMASFHLV